jgi:hypothetical protein
VLLKLDAASNPFARRFWLGGIDSRPVALFRICYGALLLKDALYHLPLAERLYSDQGILPRYALFGVPYASYRFSLMDALGPPALVAGFFLAWALVAGCLMVGYRTRLAALLSYVMVLSVQYRNTYVLDGSDAVFRVLGFWALFLPLGDHFSIDARLRRAREGAAAVLPVRPAPAWALPVRLAQVQVALVYLATAALKLRSGAWLSGDALFYTRQLDSLMLPLGRDVLAAAPDEWLRIASIATLAIEGALPFLLLSPFGQPAACLLGLGLGVALHLGIAATMSIANFSLLMISSYWLFVRWEWVQAAARRLGRAYDPVEADSPPVDPVHEQPARQPVRTALAAALVYVMACVGWQNLWTVYHPSVPTIPILQVPLLYLGLWQQWNMFLAGGRRPDGWVQAVATFQDGRVLDVERRAPPADEMPRHDWGPWLRWRQIERHVDTMPPVHLQAWAENTCVAESTRALGTPVLVELRHRVRAPHAPGAPRSALETIVRWRQQCAPAADSVPR